MLTASCMFYACTAHADETPGTPATPVALFSGDVQFNNNFVARGISQSQGQPSVQAEIDYNSGDGIYAGMDGDSIDWINQLHPGDDVSLDVDGWLGYRAHSGSDWSAQAGFKRMQFPGYYARQSPPVTQPNFTEAFGTVAWRGLSAQLNYAVTDYAGNPDSRGTAYLNVSLSQPVGAGWTLGVGLGRVAQAGRDAVSGLHNSRFDYTDYKLSVACALGSGISLTLAHTWTNGDLGIYMIDGYAVAGHHTWLSLEKTF